MVQHILHLVVFFAFGAIFMAFHKPTLIVKGQPVQKYNCTKESDGSRIISVDVSTTSPGRGGTVEFNVTYFLKEDVTNANASLFIKYGVVNYFAATYDLCKLNILKCPLKAGIGSVNYKYIVRSYQPLGTYTVHSSILNEKKKEISCFEIIFYIRN